MAAATDTSFTNAIKLYFNKKMRKEPTDGGKDFLKDILARRPLKEKEAMFDFVDTVSSSTLNTTTGSGRRPTTVAGQVPKYRRRQSEFVADNLKVNVNRLDAKYLGRSLKEHAKTCVDLYMDERRRRHTNLTLGRFSATYKENPAVGSQTTAATDSAFPATQNYVPKNVSAAGTLHGVSQVANANPLTLDAWHQLISIHDDTLGSTVQGNEGTAKGVLDSFKRVAIFTNSGWEQFVRTNNGLFGNRDWFGKSTYLEGYGKIQMIGDTPIVILPNKYIPALTSTTTVQLSVSRAQAANEINPNKTDAAANDDIIMGAGTETMWLIYPDALSIMVPEQYNMMEPELYMEQANSLEYALYGVWAIEGCRLFDKLVSRVYFNDGANTVKA